MVMEFYIHIVAARRRCSRPENQIFKEIFSCNIWNIILRQGQFGFCGRVVLGPFGLYLDFFPPLGFIYL